MSVHRAAIVNGVLHLENLPYPDGTMDVRVDLLPQTSHSPEPALRALAPGEKMAREMSREEFRAWFDGLVGDGFEIEEPPDPPPEPVEAW